MYVHIVMLQEWSAIKMSYVCDDCNGLGVTESNGVEETCDLCGGEGRL